MSGQLISHTQADDAVFFSNLFENGIYYNHIAISWPVGTYIGPETNRYFETTVPKFAKIAYFNGYMLGAIGGHLYCSELDDATENGALGLFELKAVWDTNTDILMIKPVITDTYPPTGGVFVSDRKRITYLGGVNPKEFSEPRTTNYPALEWSAAHELIDGSLFGEKSGLCAVFGTTKGLCLGYPDGQLVNATQGKIKLPAGLAYGATLIDGNNIITTMR